MSATGTYLHAAWARCAPTGLSPTALAWRVRRAIARGEMVLHLQPEVELATGRVRAVEALVRWCRPGEAVILPGAFIDLVQRSHYARCFDSWVLRTAIAEAAALRAAGHPVRVAVNLGPATLQDPRLVAEVAARLESADLPPHMLEIEITEKVLDAERQAAATVTELAALGTYTALDDFGVGFSSLTRIASVRFSTLKIDRSLLVETSRNQRAATVFAAAVKLAHDLGLAVVAEGVECAQAWHRSARLGADLAQGWMIAPALPRAELVKLLSVDTPTWGAAA